MDPQPIGQPVTISTVVSDASGNPEDPGGITLKLYRAGTLIQTYPTPVHDSLGRYHVDVPTADLTVAGAYVSLWTTTGVGQGVRNGVFYVYDPLATVPLLSLEEAKGFLGEQGTKQDELIRVYTLVATGVVESLAAPLVPRSFAEEVDGGSCLLLSHTPVVTVTSATSVWGNPAYVTADLQVNKTAGIVRLRSRGTFWNGPYDVVYTSGLTGQVPDQYVQAARRMLWHLWAPQRGLTVDSTTPDLADVAAYETSQSGAPYGVPNEVRDLLAPLMSPVVA